MNFLNKYKGPEKIFFLIKVTIFSLGKIKMNKFTSKKQKKKNIFADLFSNLH